MQNSPPQIRPARRAEAVAIQQLNDDCGLGRWPASDYAAATTLDDFALHVAVVDGRLAGFYLARLAGPDVELLKLAVDTSCRRRGIAGALIQTCLNWGREAACESCFLEVRQSNLSAIRLYERFGFRPLSIRHRYYQEPVEDALVMSRDLYMQESSSVESQGSR